jgi:hypothetical protein
MGAAEWLLTNVRYGYKVDEIVRLILCSQIREIICAEEKIYRESTYCFEHVYNVICITSKSRKTISNLHAGSNKPQICGYRLITCN